MAGHRPRVAKRVVAGAAAIVVIVGLGWFAFDAIRERQRAELTEIYVQEIISRLNLAAISDFHQRIDAVRAFINDNSMYNVDETFWENKENPASFAAGLLAYAKGTASEPVHMECSTRTNLMGQILRALDYETRVVAIFNTKKNLSSHSFLEVMNPETGRWETQDAQLDVYWRSKVSGEHVSLADAAEDLDAIEPCGRTKCGWDHTNREGSKVERLKRFLDIISLTRKEHGLRYTLYTSRADLSQIYSKESKRGTFCEVQAKRCKQGFYDIRKYSSYGAGQPR